MPMQEAAVPPPPRPPVPETREIRAPFEKNFGVTSPKDFTLHVVDPRDEVETAIEVENQLHPKGVSVDSEESSLTAASSDPGQEELPLVAPLELVNPATLQKSAPTAAASSPTPAPAVPPPPSLKTQT